MHQNVIKASPKRKMFIEANWNVPPLTNRSRDNLPNPVAGADPYKPVNGRPAIGDMMDLFSFK